MDGSRVDHVFREAKDPLEISRGPITRGWSKKFKDVLHVLMMNYQEGIGMFEDQFGGCYNLIEFQRDQENEENIEENDDGGEDDESLGENWGKNRRGQEGERNKSGAMRGRYVNGGREDENISGIKMKILLFHVKSDPEAYLEWEMMVESVFDCHNYTNLKKVKLAVVEFGDYALILWDQLVISRRINRERPVEMWDEMKQIMRKRFVPNYYYRDMFRRLQNLNQGSRSVENYFKELGVAMIRANIEEDRKVTMARFSCGLNREIQNQVELRHCVDLEEMVQFAMKVEQQLKRRSVIRNSSVGGSTIPWHPNVVKREDVKPVSKPRIDTKQETPKKGDVENYDDIHALEDPDDEGYDAVVGELLVTRRILNVQLKEEEENQRENLFHIRYFVNKKMCSVIIDDESCTNMASCELVEMDLKGQQNLNKRHAKWVAFVETFSYVIKYKQGKENIVADALSRSIHSNKNFFPFEIVYGFNPLTPLDLMYFPMSERVNMDGKKKADFVRSLHEKVKVNIEKKNLQYTKQGNKGIKKVVFEPGDWVWLNLRKERFPEKRHSKLLPRGDGPFQVLNESMTMPTN
ncbi:uncharacterized protein [Henckelia pumila]|uniref:uncharacterized protein n=1 Tax=Henckelia pumila TaxID=405737 RepID=UPI003C6E2F31